MLYEFGEYSIDNTIQFAQAPGNAELIEDYNHFIESQFGREAVKLEADLQAEISDNLKAAQDKFEFAGNPSGICEAPSSYDDFISGIPSDQHNGLFIHAICQLNVLAMSSADMFSLLAALAVVVGNNVCPAPDVVYALMIAFRQHESSLTMAVFTFMFLRSAKFSGMLKLAGDPKQVICWLLKRDDRYNISALHKQLDRLLSGLKKRESGVMQDLLIKIYLIYGRNKPSFERMCCSAFMKYCQEEVVKDSWEHRIKTEFNGIFHFSKLYMGMDPLQELEQMYSDHGKTNCDALADPTAQTQ